MTKKQPAPAPATDEWGIYDPSKAGMQALYSRLGRPILRASEKSERRARRREGKSDRPAEGVGLAIEEAKRRAGIIAAGATAPPVPEPAVATAPAPAPPPAPAPAPVVTVAPVAPVAPVAAPLPTAAPVAKTTRAVKAKTAKTAKRKLAAAVSAAGARLDAANARRTTAVARPAATPAPPPAPAPAPAPAASAPAPRRAARKTPKAKPAAAAVAPAPAVPSPSPRRPRGPVPLAAWAHAVSDAGQEPKRAEGKGLWRGIFRIPSEVALVEYARGCRIRRLVIEAASAPLDDPL
jgi:hypothetical protein